MEFYGQRATVMGLGRHGGGAAAARYLAEKGARVTVTDLADAAALADSVEELAGAGIERLQLGAHYDADFREADLVVVNPAVRPDNPFVELARAAGARIASETELFLEACRAPVIGVTGTTGKSTTAAMIAAALGKPDASARVGLRQIDDEQTKTARGAPSLTRRASRDAVGRRAWLGGNIGRSLLSDLPRITANDWVVLELSSFQLHWLGEDVRWPQLGVLTNFAPNHLDWHGSVEHYRRSKHRLLDHAEHVYVGRASQPDCQARTPGLYGSRAGKPDLLRSPIEPWADADVPPLLVPGRHNRANAALAAAVASAVGADRESIVRGLAGFDGLPHRLQTVAEVAGRLFINDSKATTPEAAIAALESMDRPTWILLGGSDKQIDLSALAAAVGRRARGAAVFGAVAPKLDALLETHATSTERVCVDSLEKALDWCWRQSQPGDSILLSPACASLDQFRDYAERGEIFTRLVKTLPSNCPPRPGPVQSSGAVLA
jgi:UDP-N-acetylmuramoylalanine--D-glutamate ligase